jgi:hypothetical protein
MKVGLRWSHVLSFTDEMPLYGLPLYGPFVHACCELSYFRLRSIALAVQSDIAGLTSLEN